MKLLLRIFIVTIIGLHSLFLPASIHARSSGNGAAIGLGIMGGALLGGAAVAASQNCSPDDPACPYYAPAPYWGGPYVGPAPYYGPYAPYYWGAPGPYVYVR